MGGVPEALAAEPNIFIYDNYPGGIGFSEPLFEMHDELLDADARADRRLPVRDRLPACVGPEGNTGPLAKHVASRILDLLLSERRCADRARRRRRASDVDLHVAAARDRRAAARRSRSPRELTYEPDTGRLRSDASIIDRVGDVLGGRVVEQRVRPRASSSIAATSPIAGTATSGSATATATASVARRRSGAAAAAIRRSPSADADGARSRHADVFVDLETTGLSGGAGTVAFLVGCGWFDLGAFQVRQFLLTSYAAERALLARVAECFDGAGAARHLQRQDVRRAGDGDALAVPPHADAARRRAALRHAAPGAAACGSARAEQRRSGRWRLPAVDARARRCST